MDVVGSLVWIAQIFSIAIRESVWSNGMHFLNVKYCFMGFLLGIILFQALSDIGFCHCLFFHHIIFKSET